MRKWIRWWGVAAFIAFIAVISAVWYLAADNIIEHNIEKSGEYIVGAKVDIEKADLSIIPLGISLKGLQVADPNSPMRNLFDVENISFHLDGKYLFDRKVIIRDMMIEDVKFNTERTESGEIKGALPLSAKKAYEDFVMPYVDLSKLKTIIEQEEIRSIENFEKLVNDFSRVKREWKAVYKSLPTNSDLAEYRERSAKIYSELEKNRVAGLVANSKKIKDLKQDIERDLDNISLNITAMQIDLDSIKTKKDRVLSSIKNDYNDLSAKYTPDIRGLKNFSKYIFKDDVLRQIDEGLQWYNRFLPLFDYVYNKIKDHYYSSKPLTFNGLDIHYQEFDPKPNFLIKLAKLSLTKNNKDIFGEIENFTFQQNITGLPTKIELSGNDPDLSDSFNFTAIIDHTNQNDKKDELTFNVKGNKIISTKINIIDNWDLNITEGNIDKKFDVIIRNGKISGGMKLNFNNTKLISEYYGADNLIINTINTVLKDVTKFDVIVNIDGNTENHNVKISSDLDGVIKNAVTDLASRESEKIKSTIKTVLDQKQNELIKRYESELDSLLDQFTSINTMKKDLKSILIKLP